MTPHWCATLSPNARVMARPGVDLPCNHILGGPMNSPVFGLLIGSTLPPLSNILIFSSVILGLWSLLKGTASHIVFLSFERLPSFFPNTALLSPTLAVNILPFLKIQNMPVDPLKLVSIFVLIKSSCVFKHPFISDAGHSLLKPASNKFLDTALTTNELTLCPSCPCPSHTP